MMNNSVSKCNSTVNDEIMTERCERYVSKLESRTNHLALNLLNNANTIYRPSIRGSYSLGL